MPCTRLSSIGFRSRSHRSAGSSSSPVAGTAADAAGAQWRTLLRRDGPAFGRRRRGADDDDAAAAAEGADADTHADADECADRPLPRGWVALEGESLFYNAELGLATPQHPGLSPPNQIGGGRDGGYATCSWPISPAARVRACHKWPAGAAGAGVSARSAGIG